jgi:hypothetical protein
MYTLPKLERFKQDVLSKYNIYNSVFITLPFDSINNTGALLPLFTEVCETGFKQEKTPVDIINFFSKKYLHSDSEFDKIDLMFRFIQYIERQIVLFDAIEDAAFSKVNNMEGRGSLRDIKEKSDDKNNQDELIEFLENFNVRTVLTAHPTQFYPGAVLGIINDLTEAIKNNNLFTIKQLLAQLGKTPFIQNEGIADQYNFEVAYESTTYFANTYNINKCLHSKIAQLSLSTCSCKNKSTEKLYEAVMMYMSIQPNMDLGKYTKAQEIIQALTIYCNGGECNC